MELNLFKKKYIAFKNYADKLPGIVLGLNILTNLNFLIKTKLPSNSNSNSNLDEIMVNYYDFDNNSIELLNLIDLNLKLYDLYIFISNRAIAENKLYFNLCNIYVKLFQKKNYGYSNGFTMHDMINKFIQGLRKNFSKNSLHGKADCYVFDLHQVITNFNRNLLDEKVSTEQFYFFWVDFIYFLESENIIDFNKTEKSFKFKNEYKQELIQIMYFSFNLMILGNNKVYDVYDLTSDDVESNLNKILQNYNEGTIEYKYYINDLLVSLVISSSVLQVCAEKNVNNIFIESFNLHKDE